MRPLLLFLLSVLICSCGPSAQTSPDTVTGTVAPDGRLQESPKDDGAVAGALVLRLGSATAAPDQRVCLPVEASSFSDLIGFQYTIRFDSAALRYDTVQNFALAGYGPSSFGTRFAERGYLSTLWTEGNLRATSLPERTALYEVCFTNLMPAGQTTEVKFQDGPTAFEVIGADMTERRLRHANGTVSSQ